MKSLDKKKPEELELVNKICKKVADRWAVEENMGGFDGIYSEFAKEVARKCLTQQRTELLEEILGIIHKITDAGGDIPSGELKDYLLNIKI